MSTWRRRILVVEDEPLVASLLRDVLEHAGFETATAPDAVEARTLTRDFDPDAALIDIHLGDGPSGLELGHLLHRTHPHVALVFLTRYADPRVMGTTTWSVPEGSSFLAKDRISDPAMLTRCIEAALAQEAPERHDVGAGSALARLTVTQLEILRLAALGLTNTAIARRRGTSERTVEQRLQSVYEALGVVSSPDVNVRVEAIRHYIAELGIPNDLTELADDTGKTTTR